MAKPLRNLKSGFTLLEVMMSLMIIAAGALLYAALMPVAAKTGKMAGNYQQAASLVQHKVDQLRGVGYGRLNYTDLLAANVIDATPNASPFKFNTVDTLDTIYKNANGAVTISDFNDKVKEVTVTLTWTGGPNQPSNGTLSVVALVPKS